jgi:hypothetical protein
MISGNLQGVANRVVRQAQQHGYIVPRQVRTMLNEAGMCESLWKDVLAVARPALTYRKGRYYYIAPLSDRVRQEQAHQLDIRNAVHDIIHRYRNRARVERRKEERIDFVQPVKVKTGDGQEHTLLTRDLSTAGIRLIGPHRLLGQKIRVHIPDAHGATSWEFMVRILWTCAVGDDLIEYGGTFLEIAKPE